MDVRATPRYTFGEASRYLGLPESTIRAWFEGMKYGTRISLPLLTPAAPNRLSFFDLASAHVLMAMKRQGASRANLRTVLGSLQAEHPSAVHPLLGQEFFLFGRQIVIRSLGDLLNLSRARQLGLHNVMEQALTRLKLDARKMPLRFTPHPVALETNRSEGWIVIDPNQAGGRPTVRDTGILAEILAQRNRAGESISDLARDYELDQRAVKEAVSYFKTAKAA